MQYPEGWKVHQTESGVFVAIHDGMSMTLEADSEEELICAMLEGCELLVAEYLEDAKKADGVIEYLQVLIPQLQELDTNEAEYALDWIEGALSHNGIPLESEKSKKRVAELKKLGGDPDE